MPLLHPALVGLGKWKFGLALARRQWAPRTCAIRQVSSAGVSIFFTRTNSYLRRKIFL